MDFGELQVESHRPRGSVSRRRSGSVSERRKQTRRVLSVHSVSRELVCPSSRAIQPTSRTRHRCAEASIEDSRVVEPNRFQGEEGERCPGSVCSPPLEPRRRSLCWVSSCCRAYRHCPPTYGGPWVASSRKVEIWRPRVT